MADVKRRSLLSLPAIGAGLTLAPPAAAQSNEDALTALVHELEEYQGWAPGNIAMAKAYAAYRIRQALGMPLPDPKNAQSHINMQRGEYERYRQSQMFKQHVAEGVQRPAPNENLIKPHIALRRGTS